MGHAKRPGRVAVAPVRLDEAATMLAHASDAHPPLCFAAATGSKRYRAGRHELCCRSCRLRFARSWSHHGGDVAGRRAVMVGVNELTGTARPAERFDALQRIEWSARTETARRFSDNSELADPHRPLEPSFMARTIGVAPEAQGRRYGRGLIDRVRERSTAHTTSSGV